ncbi:hypothetical protein AB0J37_18815 [Microbispora rosea]|uniref:hypothetical protein n=1 Tax=Microbispora rosea TaxID=58117 RepID=UPI00342590E2
MLRRSSPRKTHRSRERSPAPGAFFAELSSPTPGRLALLALAGAFQSRLDGQAE